MRYAIFGLVLVAAAAGLAVVWVVAADKPAPAAPPTAALVVVYDGGQEAKAYRVTGAKQVATLAAHFPGYEKRPSSDTAAGWELGYEVYFDYPDGVSVRLKVSSPNNRPVRWSVGRGDFEVEGDFHQFAAGLGTTDMGFEFHRGKVPATGLKVELVAGKAVVKERRGLVLPLKITNASGEAITTALAHEWHGGEWPPTSLYVSVTPATDKGPKPFAPVYIAGEDQDAVRAASLAAGKASDLELRLDWPGTGSVKADPLVQKPGKYVVRFALVFEAGGKHQYAVSAPTEVEYKSD